MFAEKPVVVSKEDEHATEGRVDGLPPSNSFDHSTGDSTEVDSDAAFAPAPLVGVTLDGRYEVLEVLGTGGMSIVYRAKLKSVDKCVAIKTLNIQVQRKPQVRDRFNLEIDTLAKLEHPNIVTVYDCVYGPDDQPYLVMDLLSGNSLEEVLLREGAMPVERVKKILSQVCAAVKFAHQKGIIHRDLKPSNIMLLANEQDFVKVVDFGLAKLGEGSRKLTQSGEFWGSPPYVSPEQIKGETCDARSDVYSLGCVMYELLVGKDPFFGSQMFELMRKHVYERPPSFKEANPCLDIAPEIEAVVFKAMEKEPSMRFQSMGEFQKAIEGIGTVSSANNPVVTPIPAPAHRVIKETTAIKFSRASLDTSEGNSWQNMALVAVLCLLAIAATILIVPRLVHNRQPAASAPPIESRSTTAKTAHTADDEDVAPAPVKRTISRRKDDGSRWERLRRASARSTERSITAVAKKSSPSDQKPRVKDTKPTSLGDRWRSFRSRLTPGGRAENE